MGTRLEPRWALNSTALSQFRPARSEEASEAHFPYCCSPKPPQRPGVRFLLSVRGRTPKITYSFLCGTYVPCCPVAGAGGRGRVSLGKAGEALKRQSGGSRSRRGRALTAAGRSAALPGLKLGGRQSRPRAPGTPAAYPLVKPQPPLNGKLSP